MECFTDDATDESEVQEMLFVDRGRLSEIQQSRESVEVISMKKKRKAHLVGLISQRIRSLRLEESVSRVEHLSSEDSKPFSSDTSRIDSLFIVELDVEFAMFDLVSRLSLQDVERIFEDVSSSNVEVDRCVVTSLTLTSVVEAREEELPRKGELVTIKHCTNR